MNSTGNQKNGLAKHLASRPSFLSSRQRSWLDVLHWRIVLRRSMLTMMMMVRLLTKCVRENEIGGFAMMMMILMMMMMTNPSCRLWILLCLCPYRIGCFDVRDHDYRLVYYCDHLILNASDDLDHASHVDLISSYLCHESRIVRELFEPFAAVHVEDAVEYGEDA